MKTSHRDLCSEGHLKSQQGDSFHLSMSAGRVVSMISARTVPAVSHLRIPTARIALLAREDSTQRHPRWPLP